MLLKGYFVNPKVDGSLSKLQAPSRTLSKPQDEPERLSRCYQIAAAALSSVDCQDEVTTMKLGDGFLYELWTDECAFAARLEPPWPSKVIGG